MSNTNQAMVERYRNNFLKEVEANVKIHQDDINATYNTEFAMPVVHYSHPRPLGRAVSAGANS